MLASEIAIYTTSTLNHGTRARKNCNTFLREKQAVEKAWPDSDRDFVFGWRAEVTWQETKSPICSKNEVVDFHADLKRYLQKGTCNEFSSEQSESASYTAIPRPAPHFTQKSDSPDGS